MARLSPFVPFGLVLAFQAWLWPFWPVFGLSVTLYNLTICEKDVIFVHPSNCQQGLQEILQSQETKKVELLAKRPLEDCVDTEGLFIIPRNRTEKTDLQ